MRFHETFWVVTGTAAPVIALAAIVALSNVADATTRMLDSGREVFLRLVDVTATGGKPELRDVTLALIGAASRLWKRGRLQMGFQLLNIVVQALLLTISLVSITYQRNVLPVWVAIALADVGLILLAGTGVAMIVAKEAAGAARSKAADALTDAAS